MARSPKHPDQSDDELDAEPPPRTRTRFEPDDLEPFSTDELELDPSREGGATLAYGAPRASRPRRRARGPAGNERLEQAIRVRLRAAGYDVEFKGEELIVDGVVIGSRIRAKFARHRDGRDFAADDDAFADVVHRYLPSILYSQARSQLKAFDSKLYLKRDEEGRGLVVMRAGRALATVTAASFITAGGEYQRGPFYAPGEHWSRATRLLIPRSKRPPDAPPRSPAAKTAKPPPAPRHAAPKTGAPAPTEPERARFIRWSADAPTDLTALASAASPLLREQRVRADEDPVELLTAGGTTIGFEPLKRHKRTGRLDLPFFVRTESGELRGHVYLKSPETPLTIYPAVHEGNISLPWAWATALAAAADRYCGAPSDPEDELSQPAGFVPDPATSEILRHRVAAHRRRLREGESAGDDAVKAAEELDIELPPGYTWVRTHLRGGKAVAADGPLRFRWTPPSQRGANTDS